MLLETGKLRTKNLDAAVSALKSTPGVPGGLSAIVNRDQIAPDMGKVRLADLFRTKFGRTSENHFRCANQFAPFLSRKWGKVLVLI